MGVQSQSGGWKRRKDGWGRKAGGASVSRYCQDSCSPALPCQRASRGAEPHSLPGAPLYSRSPELPNPPSCPRAQILERPPWLPRVADFEKGWGTERKPTTLSLRLSAPPPTRPFLARGKSNATK